MQIDKRARPSGSAEHNANRSNSSRKQTKVIPEKCAWCEGTGRRGALGLCEKCNQSGYSSFARDWTTLLLSIAGEVSALSLLVASQLERAMRR